MKIILDIAYRTGPEYIHSEYMEVAITEDELINMVEEIISSGYEFNKPKIRELKIKSVEFNT
jgi:hypothetical protein